MKLPFLLAIFLFSSFLCFSKEQKNDTINSMQVARVVPSVKKYIQYIENENGTIKFNSILTRDIQKAKYANNSVILIIQKYQKSNGVDIDSSFIDAKTLKPIAYHTDIASQGYREVVEFSKNQITNQIIYRDSVSITKFPNKNLYNGVIINDLISELELEVGKQYNINVVNPGRRHYEYTISLEVVGIEMIGLKNSNQIKCWKLNVKYGDTTRSTLEWFSFDKQQQIKTIFDIGNGAKFIREMVIH